VVVPDFGYPVGWGEEEEGGGGFFLGRTVVCTGVCNGVWGWRPDGQRFKVDQKEGG
jgi:hypothetical protein